MSETPDSMPVPPAQQPAAPAYAATTPAYAAATPVALAPTGLMLSGALLIVAFIAHLVSYFTDSLGIAVVAGLIEAASLIGAYIGFLRAGYPSRSGAARALAIVLIALYALSGLMSTLIGSGGLSADMVGLLLALGFAILIAGVAFGIVTLLTKGLSDRLKSIPLLMYVLVFALGLINPAFSGGGYLVAGIMFLVFARSTPRTTTV
jgi:hypothetical protein